MYSDLSNRNEVDYNYLFDDETSLYLRAMIENKVFDKVEQPEVVSGDLKAALEYAIKSEKLTVDVYTRMYSGINNNEVKEVLAQLIEEEKSHVEYFEKLLAEM
jgi:rubrerythrin